MGCNASSSGDGGTEVQVKKKTGGDSKSQDYQRAHPTPSEQPLKARHARRDSAVTIRAVRLLSHIRERSAKTCLEQHMWSGKQTIHVVGDAFGDSHSS